MRAIDELMPPRLREANKEAVRAAARAVREMAGAAASSSVELAALAKGADAGAGGEADARGEDGHAPAAHVRRDVLDYTAIAQTTCFPSGYLDHGNAGWRSVRPVVDAGACVGCLRCWMQCPDACIIRKDTASHDRPDAGRGLRQGEKPRRHPVGVDYALCKGCGICARACPVRAIEMVSEHEKEVPA